MVRRSIGFIVTVVVTAWAGYQLAWANDLRERIIDHPWKSFLLLALVAAAAGMLVWGVLRPSSAKVLGAFVLGVASWGFGRWVLEGIEWQQVGILLGAVAVIAGLWVWTVLDDERIPLLNRTP